MPHHLPTGTVTFLFTDVESSTHLLQALGANDGAVLERHAAIVRQALAAHHGIEISTEGDAFFAAFRSATKAVEAAVAAQRGLGQEPWPDGHPVRVRMGLHTGEGSLGGDNYVGLDVHRAARIAAAGHGGQVLLSAGTRALVEAVLPVGVALRDLGSHRLKDLNQPEHLAQLVIAALQEDFPPIRSLEAKITSAGPVGVRATARYVDKFLGRRIESEVEITDFEPNRRIAMRSTSGSERAVSAYDVQRDSP